MSLEFSKLVQQVQTMGRYLGYRSQSLTERVDLALLWFEAATDLQAVHDRITLVRKSSVSGYRGAAAFDEVICSVYPAPELPLSATLVAADGSQIYPDVHAPSLYYLINIGAFTTYYGEQRLPTQYTNPQLAYTVELVQDADGRAVTNLAVNARRSLEEMKMLARLGHELSDEARPLVMLYDGGLLRFFGANEVPDAARIESDYMDALEALYDVRALLAGYLDKVRSTYIISLLHLLHLEPDEINDFNLKTNGELEGLTDDYLMRRVLPPGARSAVMTQNSPQNKEYINRKGAEFEIAFFYVNVAETFPPVIARIDIPAWVASDKRSVDHLHALILHQCAIQGRRRYPYAMTRADELAYVSAIEKQQLNELIKIELLRQDIEAEASNKLQTKGLARGDRRQHRMGV